MNNIVEILTAAKEAFIASDFDRVLALLIPMSDNPKREIAGTACYISGLAYTAQKKTPEAFAMFQKGVELEHKDYALYEGYGASLQLNARYDEAENVYKTGIRVCGNVPTLLSHWATIELIRGNASHAEQLLKEALDGNSKDHLGWTNLGNLYQIKGYYRNAVTCYKEALTISPHYDGAISNLLLTANYTRLPREEVFEAHKVYAESIRKIPLEPFVERKPGMKYRVAYISGDFKTHSVAYFFAPVLQFHNRTEFEIFCYSDVYSPDPVTLRFQKQADQWRDIARLPDEEVARIMREDGIDILVDLNGHCGSKRLSLFRAQPAPIQMNWIGYPNTMGIPEMQYRIVDHITDPVGDSDQFHTEELLRLNGPFLCYMPSNDLPDINELPALTNHRITFGSCNNVAKLSDETIEIWSNLLNTIPDSLLKLKSKPLKDETLAEEIRGKFESHGVSRDRITLEGHRASNRDHLTFYNDIDIALDTFPYNGTTTTCESLIMGVPVLTILGDRHAARVSASLIAAIGHPEFIADSPETFATIGAELSSKISELAELRKSLRQKFRASPLADGKRLCADLESLYRDVFAKA